MMEDSKMDATADNRRVRGYGVLQTLRPNPSLRSRLRIPANRYTQFAAIGINLRRYENGYI